MKPKNTRNINAAYRPQVLIDQDKVVLPDNVVEQLDNLDDIVFSYASNLKPKAVHAYDKDQNKRLDTVIGYRIWVIQNGEPLQVKVLQTKLPHLSFGQNLKLKNLGGLYFKNLRKHYYQADSLTLVTHDGQ